MTSSARTVNRPAGDTAGRPVPAALVMVSHDIAVRPRPAAALR